MPQSMQVKRNSGGVARGWCALGVLHAWDEWPILGTPAQNSTGNKLQNYMEVTTWLSWHRPGSPSVPEL